MSHRTVEYIDAALAIDSCNELSIVPTWPTVVPLSTGVSSLAATFDMSSPHKETLKLA